MPKTAPGPPTLTVGLNAAIIAVTDHRPRVLTVRVDKKRRGLPFGPLEPARHRTLELGLREWVRDQAGLDLGYVEQLYTFGDRERVPQEWERGVRALSIAYLALVTEKAVAGGAEAQWRDIYDYFPWEDHRSGTPEVIDARLIPALKLWAEGKREDRRSRLERVAIAFGQEGVPWDGERVLQRYELLYEAAVTSESGSGGVSNEGGGRALVADHRRIVATALGRLRGKLRYRPVVFEMLPPLFTLLQLQRLVEALAGVQLHKQNFRRLVEKGGLVEGTGRLDLSTGGRPAEMFRFRRDVLRERRAPGVGLPR